MAAFAAEYVQVKVLVAESIVPSECEFGHRRTDICTVMLVDDAVGHSVGTADILELKVADPYG